MLSTTFNYNIYVKVARITFLIFKSVRGMKNRKKKIKNLNILCFDYIWVHSKISGKVMRGKIELMKKKCPLVFFI